MIQCNEFLQYSNVKSHVLEIGSGTRINFPCSYHHTNIKSYVGIEPNIHMHPYLNEFISRYNISYTVHLLNNSATDMYEIESNSISDPLGAKVLSKVYRILKPGEKCLCFEHILANSPTDFYKKIIERIRTIINDGCRFKIIANSYADVKNFVFKISLSIYRHTF